MESERRELELNPQTSGISPIAPPSSNAENGELRFTVQQFNLLNVTAFKEGPLLELLSDTIGQSISLTELRERLKRITGYYHAHGYPAAYAYLPEQTIAEDGIIEVRVLEGYLGEIHLHNQTRLSDSAALKRLPQMKSGDLLQIERLERSALLENDIPGVSAQISFNPGQDPGFTDIDVTLTDKPVMSLQFSADNQGNRYTGDGNRITLHPEISNMSGLGDKVSMTLLSGGFGMKYEQIAIQLPTYWTGDARVGVDYGELDYRLGREFLASRFQGKTRTTSLYGSYPIVRSDAANLSVEARFTEKMMRDEALSVNDSNKRLGYGRTFSVVGDSRGSGLNQYSISYTEGRLDFADVRPRILDELSAKTRGIFRKYNWGFSRLQPIPYISETASLTVALSGQYNISRNLDSSEKMALGGGHAVRAYSASEGMSDEALLVTLEFKQALAPQIQGSVFYDIGSGKLNSHPWPAVANNNQASLSGAGLGLKVGITDHGYLSVQAAWRTTIEKPVSSNALPGARVWLEIGWQM